jgi:hypothetical protein
MDEGVMPTFSGEWYERDQGEEDMDEDDDAKEVIPHSILAVFH